MLRTRRLRAWQPRGRGGGHDRAQRAQTLLAAHQVQMLTSLLPFLVALIVLPLYADASTTSAILGIPLGYFLACHGLILSSPSSRRRFVNRQDAIDHWHGAHEDI